MQCSVYDSCGDLPLYSSGLSNVAVGEAAWFRLSGDGGGFTCPMSPGIEFFVISSSLVSSCYIHCFWEYILTNELRAHCAALMHGFICLYFCGAYPVIRACILKRIKGGRSCLGWWHYFQGVIRSKGLKVRRRVPAKQLKINDRVGMYQSLQGAWLHAFHVISQLPSSQFVWGKHCNHSPFFQAASFDQEKEFFQIKLGCILSYATYKGATNTGTCKRGCNRAQRANQISYYPVHYLYYLHSCHRVNKPRISMICAPRSANKSFI